MKKIETNQKEKSFSRGCPREALDVLPNGSRLALDLLVGLGESVRVDQVGFSVHFPARIAGVGDEASLVASLRRTPRSHDFNRLTERIRDCAAVSFRRVNAVLVGCFVASEELFFRNDVLLATGVGHNPISLAG